MTTVKPRRFRVILDTCDLVPEAVVRDTWPEVEVPKYSIFDCRGLAKHRSLTKNGRVRKPNEVRAPKVAKTKVARAPRISVMKETPKKEKPVRPEKVKKVYPYRRIQEHRSQGDPCVLCNQSAAEHRPNRYELKKAREKL
jgi:hypothetical protein